MSEALALQTEVSMVVFPCEVWSESIATRDPRLQELLFTLTRQPIRLVSSSAAVPMLCDWLPSVAEPFLEVYPPTESLVSFVRTLALSL